MLEIITAKAATSTDAGSAVDAPLDELARAGAQRMIAAALISLCPTLRFGVNVLARAGRYEGTGLRLAHGAVRPVVDDAGLALPAEQGLVNAVRRGDFIDDRCQFRCSLEEATALRDWLQARAGTV